MALNADGSLNSSTNPAQPGSFIPRSTAACAPEMPANFKWTGGKKVSGESRPRTLLFAVDQRLRAVPAITVVASLAIKRNSLKPFPTVMKKCTVSGDPFGPRPGIVIALVAVQSGLTT